MKAVRLLASLALVTALVAGGMALARSEGWHLSIAQFDDRWTYPAAPEAHSLDVYEISNESLIAGAPHKATITLLNDSEIVLSLRTLHRSVCQRLQRTFADDLTRAPFRETALFGLFERQTPIEITINRSKNEFNLFSLLVIMSHQTDDSIDPFVTKRGTVKEVFLLNARRQCGRDAKKPGLIWKIF